MKKLQLAGILLLSPVLLLSGCGGVTPALNFQANWYKRTDLTNNIEDTREQLEYLVTFDSAALSNGFALSYSDGVYKTELKNDTDEQSGKSIYVFSSELNIKVSFELGGRKTEYFEDHVYTEARFLSAAEGLTPLSSRREVLSHVPYTDNPVALEASYNVYDYTFETVYDAALTTAETIFTDRSSGKEPERRTYDIEGDGSFLDNEQIVFALRGLSLATNMTFRSVNSVTGRVQDVRLSEVADCPEEHLDWSFEADGQTVEAKSVAATSVMIGYTGSNPGQPQTAVYAKKTDPLSNTYRNVLLELNAPVVYSLGTLHYRLNKATFTRK